MGRGQQGVAPAPVAAPATGCLLSIKMSIFMLVSLSCRLVFSLSKIHQDSHRPDRSVRGGGIICVSGRRQPQACRLLEQKGQEGQLPAYRGGCHSAQCLTHTAEM